MTIDPADADADAAGFTLLELAIALAIGAIIAAFALPTYRRQIERGHRMEAAMALYRAAQYVDAGTAAQGIDATPLPAGLDQAPEGGAAVYRLHVLSADESNGGYAIEAVPAASGPMHDDACGAFVLDATGRRSNGPGGRVAPPVEVCWGAR